MTCIYRVRANAELVAHNFMWMYVPRNLWSAATHRAFLRSKTVALIRHDRVLRGAV